MADKPLRPEYKLALDSSGCLTVGTDRPAQAVVNYRIPGDDHGFGAEGGIYALEPVDGTATLRLRQEWTEKLRAAVAAGRGTFGLRIVYGGFAGLEVSRGEILAALSPAAAAAK